MKQVAMVIVHLEIIFAFALIFTTAISPTFICIYTMCAVNNSLDKQIQKMYPYVQTEEKIKIDYAVNCTVTLTLLNKMLQFLLLHIPQFDIGIIIAIGFLKTSAGLIGAFRFRHHVSLNTVLHKISVLLLQLSPYLILAFGVQGTFTFVCAIVSLAAMEELTCVIFMKKVDSSMRSVFSLLKE